MTGEQHGHEMSHTYTPEEIAILHKTYNDVHAFMDIVWGPAMLGDRYEAWEHQHQFLDVIEATTGYKQIHVERRRGTTFALTAWMAWRMGRECVIGYVGPNLNLVKDVAREMVGGFKKARPYVDELQYAQSQKVGLINWAMTRFFPVSSRYAFRGMTVNAIFYDQAYPDREILEYILPAALPHNAKVIDLRD